MKIKGKWTVSSKSHESEDKSLQGLVGQWGVGVDVRITNLSRYSKGPLFTSK